MTTHQAPPPQEEDKKKQRLPWILLIVTVVIAGVVAMFAFVLKDDGTIETSLSPDQILALQEQCFSNVPPLFYDELGACYSVDPTTLSDADKAAFRVAATPTTSTTLAVVAAPGAPAAPAAPATPVAPATTSTTSTTPAAPVAPTTSGPTTTTSGTTTTTTTTTQAPGPAPAIPADHSGRQTCYSCHNVGNTSGAMLPTNPDHMSFADDLATCLNCHTQTVVALTVDSAEWVLRMSPTAQAGVSCSSDPKPAYCQDSLNGSFNVWFELNAGVFSGSARNSNLEKTLTWSGTIAASGSKVKAELSNNSGIQSTIFFTSQTTATECLISGSYSYLSEITGTYRLERKDFNC